MKSCKSCDALDIIERKDEVNFIEFKQVEKIKNIDTNWIKELEKKVKDSIFILKKIVGEEDFKFTKKTDELRRTHKKNLSYLLSC